MEIIPIDKFELQISYPKEDIFRFLNERIDEKDRILSPDGNKVFMGKIDENGFKLRRIPFLTVSNIYYIGTFIESGHKSTINVGVRYFYPAYAAIILWLCVSLFVTRESYHILSNETFSFIGYFSLSFIPFAFFAIGYLVFIVPFRIDVKKAKVLLNDLFNNVTSSEPRRSVGLAKVRR